MKKLILKYEKALSKNNNEKSFLKEISLREKELLDNKD